MTGEPSESQRRREHVQSALAERSAPERVALVLRFVAGLTEQQVAQVLGVGVETVRERTTRPPADLARVRDELDTVPAPLPDVTAAGDRVRRSRRRTRVGGVAVLAVVAIVASLVVFRGPPRAGTAQPASAPRVRLSVPWWSSGRVHVGAHVLEVPGLTDLADPGTGAVYRTADADVVLVDARGGTAVIGHNAAPGIVADPGRGWVFWLTFTRQLVAYDASQGHLVQRRSTPGSLFAQSYARPLALTDNLGYYENREGSRVWHLATGRVTRLHLGSVSMLDRLGDLQVTYVDETSHGVAVTLAGRELWRTRMSVLRARFSRDGRWLLVSNDRGVRRFAARTGREVPTGLPPGAGVQQFAFGRGSVVDYVVPRVVRGRERDDLFECTGDTPTCTRVGAVDGQVTLPE